MKWDQRLIRRFCSTGHFRLISQVRNELLAQPLSRDPHTSKLNIEAKPNHGNTLRDSKRSLYNTSTRAKENNEHYFSNMEITNRSFKDRLNSIDLR